MAKGTIKRRGDMALPLFKISDEKLGAWLRSNPVANCHKTTIPVILIEYPSGMFRWPVVPDQIIREPGVSRSP